VRRGRVPAGAIQPGRLATAPAGETERFAFAYRIRAKGTIMLRLLRPIIRLIVKVLEWLERKV